MRKIHRLFKTDGKDPEENPKTHCPVDYINGVIPNIWDHPVYLKLLAFKIRRESKSVFLIGGKKEVHSLEAMLRTQGMDVLSMVIDDGSELGLENPDEHRTFYFCKIPDNEYDWGIWRKLKERYPSARSIYELFLPLTLILAAQSSMEYFMKSLEKIAPYYLGEEFFGSIDQLHKVFHLKGKRVLEIGPLDGYQTAGLVHLGVDSVTCIDVRAVNIIKIMAACRAFEWKNVETDVDDFHNISSRKYGRFDLVCAHGVYYHSVAPFILFENLLSLADSIYLGGFCATDASPKGPYEILAHEGDEYRVKKNAEFNNVLSGVNQHGYYFHPKDLMNFFYRKNCEINIISDKKSDVQAGRFVQMLIRRTAS